MVGQAELYGIEQPMYGVPYMRGTFLICSLCFDMCNRLAAPRPQQPLQPPQHTLATEQTPPTQKKYYRKAAGYQWQDPTLAEWPESAHLVFLRCWLFTDVITDDFRIFVGDLGNEVNDDILARAFAQYSSFQKAKVIKDKKVGKSRGYGFVSFADPHDYVAVLREMNGKVPLLVYGSFSQLSLHQYIGRYIGNRPCKLRKSRWKDFQDTSRIKQKRKDRYKKRAKEDNKRQKTNSAFVGL